MTDAPARNNGNGTDQNQEGAQITSLPISVLAQYLKDMSFENPRAPQSLTASAASPNVNVNVDVKTGQVGEAVYEVVLTIKADVSTPEGALFVCEVAYAGLFSLNGLPAEHHRPVLLIEGPRLLFPFVRAIVADATRNGGFPPLMINPIDFADLYRRQAQGNA